MGKYNLLISLAILFTAFTVSEVLGAARFARDTSASASTSTQGNTTTLTLVLNSTLLFPNLTNAGAAIQNVIEFINNRSAILNATLQNLANQTADNVNNTLATLTQLRNSLQNATNATLVQVRNDINQTITDLRTRADQVRQVIATNLQQAASSAQVQLQNINTQLNSTITNVTAAIAKSFNMLQAGLLSAELLMLKGIQAQVSQANQIGPVLVSSFQELVKRLQTFQNTSAAGSANLSFTPLLNVLSGSITAGGSVSL